MAKLGEARYDENGKLSYGKAGDQTGSEVAVREITNKENWAYVYRPMNSSIAIKMADATRQACENNNIGYAQYGNTDAEGRYGLYIEMLKTGNIANITKKCNVDCSAMVADICIISGISVTPYMSTSDEDTVLMRTGAFSKIAFNNGMELKAGDVLWRKGHTAIVIEGTSAPSRVSHIYNGVDLSPVFKWEYYLKKYEDLRKAGLKTHSDAWKHFITYGMKEARQASPDFEVKSYKERYVDLRKAFGNSYPLYYVHYCAHGLAEKRIGRGMNVGDTVKFTGQFIYVSSTAKSGGTNATGFTGTITQIADGAAHPYHVIATNSHYSGWCSEGDIVLI